MAASRIDDLRRRVEADPASIAFAQLAEEYRRAGQSEEAVRVCREGLTRHPAYLSARVTLGRALLDMGDFLSAREELEFVTHEAPENLAAVRGLAEIFHREGAMAEALEHYKRALTLARHDPELEEIVEQLSRQVGAEAAPSQGLSFEEAHEELMSAAERVPLVAPTPVAPNGTAAGTVAPFDFDKLVAALGSPAGPPLPAATIAVPEIAVPEIAVAPPQDAPLAGTDPFASLEAELRSREQAEPMPLAAAPEPESESEPESAPELVAEPAANAPLDWAPAPVFTDVRLPSPDVTGEMQDLAAMPEAPAFVEVGEPSPAEPLPWEAALAAAEERPWPWETETHDAGPPVAPIAPDELDAAPPLAAPALAASEPLEPMTHEPAADLAPPATTEPVTGSDDVLDDLEGWLNTLQSRVSQ